MYSRYIKCFSHVAEICKTLLASKENTCRLLIYLDESVEGKTISTTFTTVDSHLSCKRDLPKEAPHAKKSLHDRILSVVRRAMYRCFKFVCMRSFESLAQLSISLSLGSGHKCYLCLPHPALSTDEAVTKEVAISPFLLIRQKRPRLSTAAS